MNQSVIQDFAGQVIRKTWSVPVSLCPTLNANGYPHHRTENREQEG